MVLPCLHEEAGHTTVLLNAPMARYLTFVAAAASLASTVSTAATTGSFNVLTMNVAGLPAIFNGNDVTGDKATNAGTIGTFFAEYDYDVIHVQEGDSFVSNFQREN